jgi:NAD(P)H-flavin reductase
LGIQFDEFSDYFHVTKRFGSIAAAQLPIHYMLSMRNRYSPLAVIFGTSHEQLIHWHQVYGRIIMILIALHGALYINYFVQTGILVERLQARPSMTGLLCLALMSVLTITSIEKFRQWSYRAFYFCHLAIGLVVLPILFFHTSHLRLYVVETLALFIADRILRQIDTITDSVTITQIPATDLLKVQVHIPASKVSRFKTKPGQHVYMCISSGSRCSGGNRLLSNPFTVANISEGEIALLLRTRRGPTTQMLLTHADRFNAQPLINIEGPYGTSVDIADVTGKFDRVLLVAGGIGATFVLPVYRALREHLDSEVGGHKRLNFTWALRSAAEVAWAIELEDQVFADNPDVHIYLTRQASLEHSFRNSSEGMEMGGLRTSDGLVGESKAHMGRPNLREIVDKTFSYHGEESVAVFFCGPHDMGRELRAHVGRWVAKGRSVFWRQESFGS